MQKIIKSLVLIWLSGGYDDSCICYGEMNIVLIKTMGQKEKNAFPLGFWSDELLFFNSIRIIFWATESRTTIIQNSLNQGLVQFDTGYNNNGVRIVSCGRLHTISLQAVLLEAGTLIIVDTNRQYSHRNKYGIRKFNCVLETYL